MGDPDEPQSIGDHLREYLRDSALWPVLIVGIAIFATLGGAVLLTALRGRNLFALLAIVVIACVTADAVIREVRKGGPGLVCGIALSLWALSGAAALGVIAMGWY